MDIRDPQTDVTIRLAVLKLCETLYRPKEEPVPKLKFRLPVSAAPSAAPAAQGELPRIKLFASGNRAQAGAEPTVVSQDDFTSSAVVQPSALTGVPQPQGFYQGQQRKPSNSKAEAKKAEKEKAKKNRAPKAHKAQAAGMSPQDVQACRNCHAKIVKDPVSTFFRVPVDPARDGAPGYFERIKRPMDLMTINAKLENGQYSNCDEFRQDFEQIVENARTYNGPDHQITKLAVAMETKFNKQWTRIESTLARKRDQDTAASMSNASPGKLTIKPSGQGEAALSIDHNQIANQSAAVPLPKVAPIQPFKLKLSGTGRAPSASGSPSVNAPAADTANTSASGDSRSAAVPLPTTSMPPPKTKFKISFGGNKPKPAIVTSRTASPAGSPPSTQKSLKKVKIAAPAAMDAAPSRSPEPSSSVQPDSTNERPTAVAMAPIAGSSSSHSAMAPANTELPPPPALQSFTASTSASEPQSKESVAPPAPSPAPALGQINRSSQPPIQPPPVKISIKPPTIKIKPPKPQQQSSANAPETKLPRLPSESSHAPSERKEDHPPQRSPQPSVTFKHKKAPEQVDDADGETVISRDPLDDTQRTKNILLHIYNLPIAEWFRKPVDPVLSGCPTLVT